MQRLANHSFLDCLRQAIFWRLTGALFLGWVVLWHAILMGRAAVETRRLESAMETTVALAGAQVEKAISAYVGDLGVVVHSQSLTRLADGESRLLPWVEAEFLTTVTQKPHIAQLR